MIFDPSDPHSKDSEPRTVGSHLPDSFLYVSTWHLSLGSFSGTPPFPGVYPQDPQPAL